MKKFIISLMLILLLATSAFAYKTPYTTRTSDTYKFVYRVALELYTSPNNYNKKKNIAIDSPMLCALKAINLCSTPYYGTSTGITDVDKREMAIMLEEDILKIGVIE